MNNPIPMGVAGGTIGGTTKGDSTACGQHIYQPLDEIVPLFAAANYSRQDRSGISFHYLPEHKSGVDNFALAADLASPLITKWFGAPKAAAEVVDLLDPEALPFDSGTMLLTPLVSSDTRSYQLSVAHQ